MNAPNIKNAQRLSGCTIVCGPSAVPTTRLALRIYREAGMDIPLTVLTPQHCALDDGWKEFPSVSIAVDEEVIDYDRVSSFLSKYHQSGSLKGRSTKWYLQQYLKLAHTWESSGAIFIHDGDTVFAPMLLNEIRHSMFLLTTKEDTASYNAAARACGLPTHAASFVANGGIFLPSALRALSVEPAEWFIETMKRGVITTDLTGDFSEYQIMGSLLQERFPIRKIKVFRRFDLLVPSPLDSAAKHQCQMALKRYDAIAFEIAHRSSAIRKVLCRLAYSTGYSW